MMHCLPFFPASNSCMPDAFFPVHENCSITQAANEVLQSGGVLLPSNRNEIVDAVATLIMLHTTHLTAKQLEKSSNKLRKYTSECM